MASSARQRQKNEQEEKEEEEDVENGENACGTFRDLPGALSRAEQLFCIPCKESWMGEGYVERGDGI